MGRRGTHIGYLLGSQKERDHKEDQLVGGLDNIKMDLGMECYGLVWLRIGTSGELLLKR
jgi:hypothetical protein